MKRIQIYSKGIIILKMQIVHIGVSFSDANIESSSDAFSAPDKSDRKSLSGCLVLIDNAVVFVRERNRSGHH